MEKQPYTRVRIGKFRAHINPVYDTPELRTHLEQAPELFSATDSSTFRDSRSTRAGFVKIDIGQGKKTYFFKKAKSRGVVYSLTRAFSTCRVFRGFEIGLNLHATGFPTPEPIAALVERKWRTFKRAFYLAVGYPNARNFRVYASGDFRVLDRKGRNDCLSALGNALGRLHELGIEHGDLKDTNILVEQEENGGFKVLFADLEGSIIGPVNRDGAARDLGRLAYNFPVPGFPWTDALRVLRGYLAARPSVSLTWRDVLWDAEREWRLCTNKYGKKSR